MLEVECPAVTPEVVLKASGHVDRFTDFMVGRRCCSPGGGGGGGAGQATQAGLGRAARGLQLRCRPAQAPPWRWRPALAALGSSSRSPALAELSSAQACLPACLPARPGAAARACSPDPRAAPPPLRRPAQVTDVKTGDCYRADHLLEHHLEAALEDTKAPMSAEAAKVGTCGVCLTVWRGGGAEASCSLHPGPGPGRAVALQAGMVEGALEGGAGAQGARRALPGLASRQPGCCCCCCRNGWLLLLLGLWFQGAAAQRGG
jgi:hypothetical protein